jgi:hypothetical protein
VIQLLALFYSGSFLDGGTTLNACALASLLFWTCAVSLLLWHHARASRLNLLFLRWGLLAFVSIGTPLLEPVVKQWAWLPLVLSPSIALFLVGSLMYVVFRVMGWASPFDELGLRPPFDDAQPPPEV